MRGDNPGAGVRPPATGESRVIRRRDETSGNDEKPFQQAGRRGPNIGEDELGLLPEPFRCDRPAGPIGQEQRNQQPEDLVVAECAVAI